MIQNSAVIPGFSGRYLVTMKGQVYDLKSKRFISSHHNVRRTLSVKLRTADGRQTTKTMTGLIGAAFVENAHGFRFTKLRDPNMGYIPSNIVWVKNQDSPVPLYA